MITNWEVPFELEVFSLGLLPINQAFWTQDERRFQLEPAKCSAVLPVRSTEDDLPQGDGKIPHRRWRSGYGAHLAINLWQEFDETTGEGNPACDEVLVDMTDTLSFFLNPMIRTGLVQGEANARLTWSPPGKADRMLDRCQLASAPTPSVIDGALGGTVVELDIDSPYPYYMDAAEVITVIDDGATQTIVNPGNTDFFPVVQVYGAYTGFDLVNNTVVDADGNPARLTYDASLPPGHGTFDVADFDYIEFTFFRGSGYLNGNGPGRLGGVRWDSSDFFPLVPGPNVIDFTATDGDANTAAWIKWNGAYA